MRVELLWWEGCPSYPQALDELKHVLRSEGLDPDGVDVIEIESEEQAEREGFPGSPTIRLDGEDLLPPGEGAPAGLTCRLYRLRDGRPSPTPDPGDVRDAIRKVDAGHR
ncbi:MAG TPA: hypothetical protein VIM03_08210 [Thermoleophilaceae bacterium]